ncbi:MULTISPECIES: DUF1289 domain-containing protein [unclassified Rhizobium]|uniref:DUF1289 domain-containing protein n=1 Tax=unclassified Rhizobium TaxID=2613769 RepID=UPI003816A695
MKLDSPCTDICQFDPRNKWCLGCGRTVLEIKDWRKLSPYHRTALAKELKQRVEKTRQRAQAGKEKPAQMARTSEREEQRRGSR